MKLLSTYRLNFVVENYRVLAVAVFAVFSLVFSSLPLCHFSDVGLVYASYPPCCVSVLSNASVGVFLPARGQKEDGSDKNVLHGRIDFITKLNDDCQK